MTQFFRLNKLVSDFHKSEIIQYRILSNKEKNIDIPTLGTTKNKGIDPNLSPFKGSSAPKIKYLASAHTHYSAQNTF